MRQTTYIRGVIMLFTASASPRRPIRGSGAPLCSPHFNPFLRIAETFMSISLQQIRKFKKPSYQS